jgi:hypothetical protein
MPRSTSTKAKPQPADSNLKCGRSKLTNRFAMVPTDGRSMWQRRYRDLVTLYVEDLGGPHRVSQAELSLIRRASTIQIQLEIMEAAFADGTANANALEIFGRASGNLRRIFQALQSMQSDDAFRKAKNVTPSLGEYLAALNEDEASGGVVQ